MTVSQPSICNDGTVSVGGKDFVNIYSEEYNKQEEKETDDEFNDCESDEICEEYESISSEFVKDDMLVHIETPKLEFVLKGTKYGVADKDAVRIESFNHPWDYVKVMSSRRIYLNEYSNYEVIIRSKDNAAIEFVHENINIRNKVKPVIAGFLSGIINFKGDIGFTDIIIKADNMPEFKITLEVYPAKISYKEDYAAILEDVNTEIYNLAYGFLGRTYLGSEVNNHKNNSYTEFYSILNYVSEKILKAIDIICLNPNHELKKSNEIVKCHNIKNVSMETIRYLERNPHLLKNINGRYVPEKALQSKKIITVDTKENRFTKFMIIRIQEKVKSFINKYLEIKSRYKERPEESIKPSVNGDIDNFTAENNMSFKDIEGCSNSNKNFKDYSYDAEIIKNLRNFNEMLERKLRNTFLNNVPIEYNSSISLVFSIGNGYRELYKYYLMLQKGLSIKSSIFSLSMKELSLLYEYWCFIKINSILQKKYKLLKTDMIKINRDGIVVSLKKGSQSKLVYENPKTKEKFIVSYNSKKSSKTVAQKPDNILSLYKESSPTAYEFIFDAKYKIDDTAGYKKRHNTPGPKEEDINTMHRYRDAIIYDYKKEQKIKREIYKNQESEISNTAKDFIYNKIKDSVPYNADYLEPKEIQRRKEYKNCIFGAFVLFPYNDEKQYKENTFYKSIEEVNIGGIPFLPSSNKIMEEFLDELINEDADCVFERALHHVGKVDL